MNVINHFNQTLFTAGSLLEWKKWFSNLSRFQKACLTALWSHDTLISSFMNPATSLLTHSPIRAKPIRRMWGRDEIGLFNSLYRNRLMQDNDSLIACYYRMYWRPNTWQKSLYDTWKCRLGLLREWEFNFYFQLWCCWGASFEVGNEDWCLTLLLLIYWWCCQKHYK